MRVKVNIWTNNDIKRFEILNARTCRHNCYVSMFIQSPKYVKYAGNPLVTFHLLPRLKHLWMMPLCHATLNPASTF